MSWLKSSCLICCLQRYKRWTWWATAASRWKTKPSTSSGESCDPETLKQIISTCNDAYRIYMQSFAAFLTVLSFLVTSPLWKWTRNLLWPQETHWLRLLHGTTATLKWEAKETSVCCFLCFFVCLLFIIEHCCLNADLFSQTQIENMSVLIGHVKNHAAHVMFSHSQIRDVQLGLLSL